MSDSIKQDDVPSTGSSAQVKAVAEAIPAAKLQRTLAVMLTIVICLVMVGDVQAVALNPLVATISQELGLSGSQVGWILNGYTLVGAAFSGLLSRLGDAVGPKRVLFPVFAVSLVGAVICGLAVNMEFLVVGRMLMGFSIPSIPLIWGLIRPRATAEQNRRITLAQGAAAGAFIPLTLILGGLLVTLGLPWQSLFWVTAAFLALSFALLWTTPESPVSQRIRIPLDTIGGLGLAVWLTFLLLTLSYGPTDGWSSPNVVTFAIIAAVVFAAWVVQQVKNPHRLMAFQRNDLRQMLSGYTAVWIGGTMAPVMMFLFLPALLQTPSSTGYGLGLSVFESTLPMILLAPISFLLQFVLAPMIDKFGPRMTLFAGGALCALGFMGMGLAAGTVLLVYVWFFIYACGSMTLYMTGFSLTTASGRQDNISVTVGLQYAGLSIVVSLTVAVALSFFIPNAQGILPETVFLTGFIGAGVTVLASSVAWLLLAPKTFVDKHAATAAAHG